MARRWIMGDYFCAQQHAHSNMSEVNECNRITEENESRKHAEAMAKLQEESDRNWIERENMRLTINRQEAMERNNYGLEMRRLDLREKELELDMMNAKIQFAQCMQNLAISSGRMSTHGTLGPPPELPALEWYG